jgi:hypothetical protein
VVLGGDGQSSTVTAWRPFRDLAGQSICSLGLAARFAPVPKTETAGNEDTEQQGGRRRDQDGRIDGHHQGIVERPEAESDDLSVRDREDHHDHGKQHPKDPGQKFHRGIDLEWRKGKN